MSQCVYLDHRMKIVFYTCLLGFFLLLCGCGSHLEHVGQAPRLSPVGAGLKEKGDGQPLAALSKPMEPGGLDLFRDRRAHRVGDIVTVKIAIDDRASLDNESGRSRDSKISGDAGFNTFFMTMAGTGGADWRANAKSTQEGKGNVERSESITLSIAAVVTDVLPNGNLKIQGSQEVRVNFELRELQVAGLVHPQDIGGDNTVSYDRIAEARISYGGRGRLMEAQQPGWGQQIYDQVVPF